MKFSIIAAVISASLIVLATAWGVSKIAKSSLENMARQPEIADKIRIAMLLSIAFMEGIALLGLVICFMTAT